MESLLKEDIAPVSEKKFQKPKFVKGVPKGYMTGNEFERRVLDGLKKRLIANGYFTLHATRTVRTP